MYAAVWSRLSGRLSGGRKCQNPFFKYQLKRFSDNPQSLNKPQNSNVTPEPPVKHLPQLTFENATPIKPKPPSEPTLKNVRLKMRSAYPKANIIIETTVRKKAKEGHFMKWLAVTSGFATLGSLCWMMYDYNKNVQRNFEQHVLTILIRQERLAQAKHNTETLHIIGMMMDLIRVHNTRTNAIVSKLHGDDIDLKKVVHEINLISAEIEAAFVELEGEVAKADFGVNSVIDGMGDELEKIIKELGDEVVDEGESKTGDRGDKAGGGAKANT